MPKLQDYVWDMFKIFVVEQILSKAHSVAVVEKRKAEKVKVDGSSEDLKERIQELMQEWDLTIEILGEPMLGEELDDFSKHVRKLLKREIRRAIGSLDFSKLFRIEEKKGTK